MNATKVLTIAKEQRPTTIKDEVLYESIMILEGEIAEMMGEDVPTNTYPNTNKDLLMPFPHDDIYAKYLMAQIDLMNQDITQYQNDNEVFYEAFKKAKAWYRRNNRPEESSGFEVM